MVCLYWLVCDVNLISVRSFKVREVVFLIIITSGSINWVPLDIYDTTPSDCLAYRCCKGAGG